MAPSSTVKSPRASAARFIRREPWVTLNMAVAFGAATVFLSIAWLEAFGIVRVFTVVTTHPSGAISGDRVLGIESVSRTLTHARSEALLVLAVAFTFWVLRVALQTADHQIGLLRTVGLLMPPITLGVLAGAMHAITDAVVSDASQRRVHRAVTSWCALSLAAAVLDLFSGSSWGTGPGPTVFAGSRLVSMLAGATSAAACILAIALAVGFTYRWASLERRASRTLETLPH